MNELFSLDAITDITSGHFVGREEEIRTAIRSFSRPHQSCIVYGERGIGKTSLAWKILNILEKRDPEYGDAVKEEYSCVFVSGLNDPQDTSALIRSIVAPSQSKYSLSRRHPDIYSDDAFLSQIERTYGLDLASRSSLDRALSENNNTAFWVNLFSDVAEKIKEGDPNRQLVFFLDEIDRIQSNQGLALLIKNISHARFCLVGIADSIEDIFSEHLSTARKMRGGMIELNPFSEDTIRKVFENAISKSDNFLSIDNGFMEVAALYSGGYPWLAQHIGDEALNSALERENLYHLSKAVTLREEDFWRALPIIVENYEAATSRTFDIDFVKSRDVVRKVFNYLVEEFDHISAEKIAKITNVPLDVVVGTVSRAINAGILVQRPNREIRFHDPIVRIFVVASLRGREI